MKLNYKGWLISATPSPNHESDWDITLENYGNGRTHSFKVPNTITLKLAEDRAFTKVDEFETEAAEKREREANIQRVDSQVKGVKKW